MSAIIVEEQPHARLYYHLLAHLDLGRDAANIHRPDFDSKEWTEHLRRAYQACPHRLLAQVLPLLVGDLDTLKKVLRRGMPPLNDATGRSLRYQLLTAIELEEEAFFASEQARSPRRIEHLLPRLDTLRGHLWGTEPPHPLHLWDCPALLADDFTHARTTRSQQGWVIALSLDAPDDEVLIQILHEDTHSITDPAVRRRFEGITQDTRAGSAGLAMHRALEQAVVDAGQELFEGHAPELLPAYQRWRKRFGMPKLP
ncbi:MAG: hypothetical protein ACNA8W_19840 [Bradymonadaceae bacterium]